MFKKLKLLHGPSALLPNKFTITSDQKGILPLSEKISETAKAVMVLPELRISSLILIGQLCDDNCKALLTKKKLNAVKSANMF